MSFIFSSGNPRIVAAILPWGRVESYQISLGGSADEKANIGTIVGSSFSSEEIILAIEKIINVYLSNRRNKRQTFLQTFKRIGIEPFKKALYDSP